MRELSMAFRNKGSNSEESLRLAKEVVSKDMADGKSWANLGNAYMAVFFSSSFDQVWPEAAIIIYNYIYLYINNNIELYICIY